MPGIRLGRPRWGQTARPLGSLASIHSGAPTPAEQLYGAATGRSSPTSHPAPTQRIAPLAVSDGPSSLSAQATRNSLSALHLSASSFR